MILIFSQSEDETSTENVIDWLFYKKQQYFRLNGSDLKNNCLSFELSDKGSNMIIHNEKIPSLNQFKAVWFRRWANPDFMTKEAEITAEKLNWRKRNSLDRVIKLHLKEEGKKVSDWFLSKFKGKMALSSSGFKSINKIDVLEKSCKLGLEIPATLITSKKKELSGFIEKYKSVITKPISEGLVYVDKSQNKEECYSMFTEQLDYQSLDRIPENFIRSLFQEKLNKAYEIRSFFIDNNFYSMAIFSQCNPNTGIDFRHYDTMNPNRNEPYALPRNVEEKLAELMKLLELETGSIDIVKTTDGRFAMLEVNPVGQFGMVSLPCNYYLEEKVADALIRRAN